MKSIIYTDTLGLVKILKNSNKNNYNRSFTPEDIKILNLDPEGIHVLRFQIWHEHKKGVKVDTHLRSFFLVKQIGIDAPLDIAVDCEFEIFIENTFQKNVA